MIPVLTSRGRAALVLVLALVVLAIGGLAPLLWPAEVILAILGWAYMRGVLRLRALERGALHLALELDVQGLHRGDPLRLQVRLENRSASSLAQVRLRLPASRGMALATQQLGVDHLWAGTGVTLRVDGRAARTGRWGVEGTEIRTEDALGLVSVRLHQQVKLDYVVLPSRGAAPPTLALSRVAPTRAPMGAHPSSRKGDGSAFHQLREFVAGDALRHVDWRTSARHGRVVVRETEAAHAIPVHVVVDTSTTMRSGAPLSKLEHALELAYGYGQLVLGRGDLLGSALVGEAEPVLLAPGRGPRHERALIEHVTSTNVVADPAQCELDREGLRDRLVNYLLVHQRLDFREPPGGAAHARYPLDGVNEPLLERWVGRQLGLECDGLERCLLAYAAAQRIDLPYRAEARAGLKEHALAEVLRTLERPGPQEALVITDLGGILDLAPLTEALNRRASLGLRTAIVVPHTPDYVDPADWIEDPTIAAPVFEAFSVAEHQRRGRLISDLRKTGATVISVTPDTGLEALLAWG